MPIHTNSIGAATFQDLVGTIELRQQRFEIIDRPGVDGSGVRATGVRGKPFVLVSVSYHDDFSDYKTDFESCIALKSSLQELYRNSISYGNFVVIDVAENKPPQAVLNVAGAPGANVRAEIRWTLLQP